MHVSFATNRNMGEKKIYIVLDSFVKSFHTSLITPRLLKKDETRLRPSQGWETQKGFSDKLFPVALLNSQGETKI